MLHYSLKTTYTIGCDMHVVHEISAAELRFMHRSLLHIYKFQAQLVGSASEAFLIKSSWYWKSFPDMSSPLIVTIIIPTVTPTSSAWPFA